MADIIVTIGAAGDYASFDDFRVALPSLGTSGDTVIARVIDVAVNASTVASFPASINASHLVIESDASVRHSGSIGSGATITATANDQGFLFSRPQYTVIIRNLIFNHAGFRAGNLGTLHIATFTSPAGSYIIENVLVYGYGANTVAATGYGVYCRDNLPVTIRNCWVFGPLRNRSFGETAGIWNATSGGVIAHCVVYQSKNLNGSAPAAIGIKGTCYNCVSVDSGVDFSSATGSHNASSDTTAPGVNSIVSVVASNEFGAISNGPHIVASSQFRGAGISGYAITDIDGDTYLNPPSIGADEFVSATLSMTRRRQSSQSFIRGTF